MRLIEPQSGRGRLPLLITSRDATNVAFLVSWVAVPVGWWLDAKTVLGRSVR